MIQISPDYGVMVNRTFDLALGKMINVCYLFHENGNLKVSRESRIKGGF